MNLVYKESFCLSTENKMVITKDGDPVQSSVRIQNLSV